MADERWRPLRAREGAKAAQHDVLLDGVPPWLQQALIAWLDEYLLREEDHYGNTPPSDGALQAVEVNVRIEPGLDWRWGAPSARDSLVERCKADPDLFLSVLDFALLVVGRRNSKATDHLDALLAAGGSAWCVAPDRRALVRRVLPEAASSAAIIIETGSRAGAHIAEAWREAFGRQPHPGTAYREAVRAVEAAVCPVVIPMNAKPTLGKAIAAFRDAPQGKFECVFPGTESGASPLQAVRELMELVWTNQHDRHAAIESDAPLHVSQEAEAAIQR
jgi:hypothetical protein